MARLSHDPGGAVGIGEILVAIADLQFDEAPRAGAQCVEAGQLERQQKVLPPHKGACP